MTVLRLLGSLLLAAALVLMPSQAFAYAGPEEEEMVVTDTNPEPGEPFEVIVVAEDSEEVTLTITSDDADDSDIEIAGTQSLTKATNAAWTARFTVTLYEEGVYAMTSYDENMNVIERTQIVVGDGEPGADGGAGGDADGGAGAGAGAGGSADSGAGIGLGDTGASSSSLLLGGAGLLLLAGGGAALLFSRRRKTQFA